MVLNYLYLIFALCFTNSSEFNNESDAIINVVDVNGVLNNDQITYQVENNTKKINSNLEKFLRLSIESFVEWVNFKKKYGKIFHDFDTESEHIFKFLESKNYIENHNQLYEKGNVSFMLGLNKFADYLFNDYKKVNGFYYSSRSNALKFQMPSNKTVPKSIDWRKKGYVTPVKDEGNCGSSWAFSVTGSLEGQHKRATGKLVSLSVQNLVDCTISYVKRGCSGGVIDSAYDYIRQNEGIDTEKSYPYVEKDDKCRFKKADVGAVISGYVYLPEGDEEQLKIAVGTIGPISATVNILCNSFQFYQSGIYNDDKCVPNYDPFNHAVLVVGYGTDPKYGDYWIIKNSWGKSWGEKGYMRLARNRNNLCGIATAASYPIV